MVNRAPTDARQRRPLRETVLIGLLLLVVVVLFRLPTLTVVAAQTQVRIATNNAAHLPLFGIMALVLFALSILVFRTRFSKRATHYRVAFGVAIVLAAGTELVQLFGPRDADLADVTMDLLGAGAALAVLATVDRGMAGTWVQRPWWKRVLRLGAALTLVLAVMPVLLWAEAYQQRDQRFPILAGFDTYWERKFFRVGESELTLTRPPADWSAAGADRVGRWSGKSGAYPYLAMLEPYPDWRGYESLRLSIYSIEDDPVRVSITIRDAYHTPEYTDRFTGHYVLQPGSNEIEVALDEIRTSPETREMDISAIESVALYSRRPTKSFTLYVGEVRLISSTRARTPQLP